MKLKTTRLFSLQLEQHDGFYGPPPKYTFGQRLWRGFLLLPAVILFFMPTFQLGKTAFKAAPVAVPSALSVGDLFLMPEHETMSAPYFAGGPMSRVRGKQPSYMAAVPPAPSVEMGFTFVEPEPAEIKDADPKKKRSRPRLKMPSMKHPIVELFHHRIKIAPAAERFPASAVDLGTPRTRWDGSPDLSCWTAPTAKPIEDVPLMIRRRGLTKMKVAAVSVVGPGEVAMTSGSGTERSVLVYHGGGLYTRYMDLAEVAVKKGDRVRAGARIGAVPMAGRKPASVQWKAWLGKTPVNPQSLLEQSSRLCGSK